jgi:hypothetical protein
VRLISSGASGTARITAYSGGASSFTDLRIGTAAAGRVVVTVTPQALGAAGGNVQVVANVTDEGGNPLSGIPVSFTTDKGSVSPSTATTDANGNATTTLTTTSGPAKVTARAGAQTGDATVTVNARGLASFTAAPTATSAGVPVTFTVTPTTGVNLSNVRVDFGDGSGRDLGPIGGATTVPHAYSSPGTYTATARATDASGDSGTLSTDVLVASLPITLTGPATASVNTPVTFTVGGIPAGAQVASYEWTFSDGTTRTTTGPQLTHPFSTRGAKLVRVRVIGVGGGLLGEASTGVEITT